MAIEWTEDLATSVVEIDRQHKEIFKKMDDLYLACRRGKGKAEVAGLIEFLKNYVAVHFDTEEKYMQQYDYPGYTSHKVEHTGFIKTIVDLKRQLETEGPNLALVIKTNLEVSDWLKKHICEIDKKLGSFLKTRSVE